MPSGGSSERLSEALEALFNQERAAVLGRMGRRAETAISRCEQLLASVDTASDRSIDAYEKARQAALDAVADLCLQREIVGLTDQKWVHQTYRVPRSLRPRTV